MSSKNLEPSSKFGHSLLSLYHETISASENSAISPISVFICMYLLNHGAKEETKGEIMKALCLSKADGEEALTVIEAMDNSHDSLFTMSTANGLFIQHGIELDIKFVDHLKNNYEAHVENVKFGSPEGEKIVDDWVEKQTNGKIKNAIKGSTDKDTVLALVNAVYMKGKWAEPFEIYMTSKGEFTTIDNQIVNVDFMHQTEKFKYIESKSEKFQLAFFPYRSRGLGWEMGILLPNKGEEPRNFLKFLEGNKLMDLKKKSGEKKLNVVLPKCRIEATIDLIPMFRKLGVNLAFSDDADFSGISSNEALKVSNIYQKCFVDIDEGGTEAAAATVFCEMELTCPYRPPADPIPFHATSPYIYFIHQPYTGIVLFAGVVANPQQ